MKNRMQTRDRLKRFMDIDTKCLLCEEEEENINHLFCQCRVTRKVVKVIFEWMNYTIKGDTLKEMGENIWRIKPARARGMVMEAWMNVCYNI